MQTNAQAPKDTFNDTELIDKLIDSKGTNNRIVFDSSNIKQYWIEKSIISDNGNIMIQMNSNMQSIPLKFQFANVNEAQDCTIDIITDNPSLSFSVLNTKQKTISDATKAEVFMGYHILSNTIHMEDTQDLSLYLVFKTNSAADIKIKKIAVYFSNNKESSFLQSPGKIAFNKSNMKGGSALSKEGDDFVAQGKRTQIFASKQILINNNTLKTHVVIKNIGECPCKVFIGYMPYAHNGTVLDPGNYPYKENSPVLNVVSVQKSDKTIIVDGYPEWEKGCKIAFNANSDLSDIPNTNTLNGTIVSVTKMDNGNSSIVMSTDISDNISKGSKIRVQGLPEMRIYTNTKILQPNEEESFDSELKKDKTLLQFSNKAFSRGVYYVRPILFSYTADPGASTYSLNPQVDNTILIKEYSTSY